MHIMIVRLKTTRPLKSEGKQNFRHIDNINDEMVYQMNHI